MLFDWGRTWWANRFYTRFGGPVIELRVSDGRHTRIYGKSDLFLFLEEIARDADSEVSPT